MGAQLFTREGERKDRHDEANSCFLKFCERAHNDFKTVF